MIKEEVKNLVEKSIKNLQKRGKIRNFELPEVIIEHPREKVRGDYSTSIGFSIAKNEATNPFEIAMLLKEEIEGIKSNLISKVEVVNGFANFYVAQARLKKELAEIIKVKNKYGQLKTGKNQKVNVEFISANPTGPLTLGNGRGGFCGDVLANVLSRAGYKVAREYYINDRGEQIVKLGHSVLGDNLAVYKGEYIEELRKKVKGKYVEEIGEKSAKYILDKMIKPTIKRMGIKFDVWFSENNKLYKTREVDKVINDLTKKGFTYKSEGALWFKCKELEDDKDRVLIRKDGAKTYFASDIAYLKNKFKRGFKNLIFFLGADHYGYVPRLKAAAKALGHEKEQVEAIVMQMVRLFKDGKEVKMSKRTGVYVTLEELLDEVNLDVARFFFLTKSSDTHFNFDMNLAKEQSSKNPVYYVQYAYARISSILKKAKNIKYQKQNLNLLKESTEIELIKQLTKFPEIVFDTANDYQVQRLPQYALDLADSFHRFYENCRVISENKELTKARLSLILATKVILKNTLDLMGISAPEKM